MTSIIELIPDSCQTFLPKTLDIVRNKVYRKPAFEAVACTSDRFFNPHYPIMDVYTKNYDLPAMSESFSELLLLKIIL
jgi:hypothetical protein